MMARFCTVALTLLLVAGFAHGQRGEQSTFQEQLDFTHLGSLAVHSDGRVRSYGSFARYMMQFVSGARVVDGQPPSYTYIDLMLRPRAYEDADVIFVRNKPMREGIAMALRQSVQTHTASMFASPDDPHAPASFPDLEDRMQQLEYRLASFMATGLISERMLRDPLVNQTVESMRQDLLRTARFVEELDNARVVMQPDVLRQSLKLIPPPGGGFNDPWLTFEDLAASLTGQGRHRLAAVDMELKSELLHQWEMFQQGWRERDASKVNAASAQLAHLLPQVNPELYPGEGSRTGWPWSIDTFGWKWTTTTLLAAIMLAIGLLGAVSNRPQLAMVFFTAAVGWIAFVGGAYALGRTNPLTLESWYFASRNMTWIWVFYGLCLVPLLLSLVFRWKAAHWIGMALFMFAFGLQTAALLIRWYVSDRWPNSNMFEAVTTAAWFGGCTAIFLEIWVRKLPLRSVFALGSAASSMVALMCAFFMPVGLNPNISNMMPVLHDVWLYIHTNVIILSYCLIFMAAVSAVLYLLYRGIGHVNGFGSAQDYARMGGAASLIQTTPDGQTYIAKARTNIGQVLDGTTMILMELSFVLLWAGLVMGAIWADHSWGRPWGWDPKEVFALNTFIVFLVLIHGRLKARDKGVWTAVTAIIGAAVMLFNWVAINFVVVGLHSYA